MPGETSVRTRVLPVAMLAVSLLLSLAAAEAVIRFIERRPTLHPAPAPTFARGGMLRGLTFADLDRPGMRGTYKGFLFRTNRHGLRGPDYRIPKPARVFRIAAIGDSFTMGDGVAEKDTYVAQLERQLNLRPGGRRYEVVNIGRAGANLDFSLKRLRAVGLDYEPDLIVYGYTANDINGPHYRTFPRLTPEEKRRAKEGRLRLLVRLRSLRDLVSPIYGSYMYELDYNYFANPAAWDFFLTGLDELAAIGEENGVCTHVLIHTWLKYLHLLHPFRRYYDAVEEASLARGLTVTTTLERFLGENVDDVRLGPFDKHPNPRGNAILAEELRRALEALPQSCWK